MKNQIKRIGMIFLAIIMTVPLVQIPAFAAISVNPPVVNYTEGCILIGGSLERNESGMRVTYKITDSSGKTVYMNQNFSGVGGSFSNTALLSKRFDGGSYTLSVHATGYDEPVKVSFEVDRTKEVVYAENVRISGIKDNVVQEGDILTGEYTFFSGFGQDEGNSKYTWAISPAVDGTEYVIKNATQKNYIFRTADVLEIVQTYQAEFANKKFFLKFSVEAQSAGSDVYAAKAVSEAVPLNTIPYASDVSIDGSAAVGKKLTGKYTYYDAEGRRESNSSYRWLAAKSADGNFEPHADGLSYIPNAADKGLYLKFEITPTAQGGTRGKSVVSQESVLVKGGSNGGGGLSSGGGSGGGKVTGTTAVIGDDIPSTSVVPNTPEFVPGEFNDVPIDHWAKITIRDVVLRGDANGVDKHHFEPERVITRAEFAKLILNTLDIAEVEYRNGFADVKKDDWYAGTVQAIVDNSIMTGFENKFSPDVLITREEMAKVIAEAYFSAGGVKNPDATLAFSDSESISKWAVDAVTQASGLGFITGLPDGTFAPKTGATRAEAVTVIDRLYQRLLP